MKKISIYLLFAFCIQNGFAIDWGTTKPIIDAMLQHYLDNKNYQSVITDEWIKTDGTTESVGDTIFAYKYNAFGYLKNGKKLQVFTDHYDIYINNTDSTIYVQEVTPEAIGKIEQMMPTMETAIRGFSVCDSARLISNVNGVKTIDFYINNSLINRSRIIIDASGWIKEIWRYYTNNTEYVSQHTKFVVMDALNTSNIPVLQQDRYVKKVDSNLVPSASYLNYALSFIKL